MCKLKFKSWTPINRSKPASTLAFQPVSPNLTGHYWLLMDSERFGLLLGPGVWGQQKYLAEGSVLLVFASDPYDPASYIEQWD